MVAGLRPARPVRMLDRKLLRELLAMRMQVLAIALVIAAGVCVQLLSSGLVTSLVDTRQAFYDRSLMADIWAQMVRAPMTVADDISQLPGVLSVEPRLRFGIRIGTGTSADQVLGEILSVPDTRDPRVNRLQISQGRMPSGLRSDEVVILKKFADANKLEVGDTVDLIVRGRLIHANITGLVHSAEHVYAIAPGEIVPDESRYAVVWMNETPLSILTGWQGAFNEAVLRISDPQQSQPVIEELDRLLGDYGASGAYSRKDQMSDLFLSSEIDQLHTLGRVVPPVFLMVACLLVYAVVSRLVAVQRTVIGLLEAFGYRRHQIILHFLKLVMLIGLFGVLIGAGLGTWFGHLMADMYLRYYDFPAFLFRAAVSDYMISAFAALGGVLLAGVFAVGNILSLQPAEAMVPAPPPDFSRGPGSLISRISWIDHQTRIVLRQIVRWPGRSFVTAFAVSASLSLMISVFAMKDAMREMLADYFGVSGRQDMTVTFFGVRDRSAGDEILRLEGVMYAEPFLAVPARLRAGPLTENTTITGLSQSGELYRLTAPGGMPIRHPGEGIILSEDLAGRLALKPGDLLDIEIVEAHRPRFSMPVVAVAPTWVGSAVHVDIDRLRRLIGESDALSGLYLRVDTGRSNMLKSGILEMPGVASFSSSADALERMRSLMDENIGVSLTVFSLFAALIAFGASYNTIRISFAEREHEFASLRVLGFSRWDVSYLLFGEIALLSLFALGPGIFFGYLLSVYFSHAMASELFRLPVVIERSSVVSVCGIVLSVVAVSSAIIRQKVDHMDLVRALKGA